MIADLNLDLHKEMKGDKDRKSKVKIKGISLIFNNCKNELTKTKRVEMYNGAYNSCESKMYDNRRRDERERL